jgi:hypothetical protein
VVKKNSLRLLAAFAAFPLMFFVACDDSSSASGDEKPASSSSVPASSDSKISSEVEYRDPYQPSTECSAENEGASEWVCTSYWKGTCASSSYYKCEKEKWVETEYIPPLPEKECTAEKEGVVDSVAEPHYDQSKKVQVGHYYYICNKNKWNLINETLAKCTTADTKVGDECCDVIYGLLTTVYPSHSELYEYTEDGWTRQGVYSDLECKEFSYDPADSCSVPAEACTEGGNNKIDSTLKSAKTSETCYSLCLNNEWKRLVIDDVKVYAHCGEPKEKGENRCCYTPPAEITEQYPWYGSAIYVYDYLFGWAVSEYYGAPNCEDPAE